MSGFVGTRRPPAQEIGGIGIILPVGFNPREPGQRIDVAGLFRQYVLENGGSVIEPIGEAVNLREAVLRLNERRIGL